MWPSPDVCQHGRAVSQFLEMPSAFCHFALPVSKCLKWRKGGGWPPSDDCSPSWITHLGSWWRALSLAVTQLREQVEQVIPVANAKVKESSRFKRSLFIARITLNPFLCPGVLRVPFCQKPGGMGKMESCSIILPWVEFSDQQKRIDGFNGQLSTAMVKEMMG